MANLLLYANNAASTLLGNLGATDTSFSLPNGTGARFPAPTAGQSFMLTIEDTSSNLEIVECTARTNDVLTVIRGREGTTAKAFTASTPIDMRVTAGMLSDLNWRRVAGQSGGPPLLDATNKLPIGTFDTPLQVYGDNRWNAKLGYAPVQQGTGIGQTALNAVKIGWTPQGVLKVTVDNSDIGVFAMQSWVDGNYVNKFNPAVINNTLVTTGNITAPSIVSGIFQSNNANWIGASNANGGSCYLRPNSNNSSVGQAILNPGGSLNLFPVNSNPAAGGSTFGLQMSGPYGGGVQFIDGTFNIGLYSIGGEFHVGFAQNNGAINSPFSVNSAGNVSMSGQLNANTVVANNIQDNCDERYKMNITDMSYQDAIALVQGIAGKRFYNKNTEKNEFGVIAQQAQTAAPEIVTTDSFGMMSVAYGRIVAPLLVVCQSLVTEMEELRIDMAALRDRMATLEATYGPPK